MTRRFLAARGIGRPRPVLVALGSMRTHGRLMRDAAAMFVAPRPTARGTLFLGRWFRTRSWSTNTKATALLTIPTSTCSL